MATEVEVVMLPYPGEKAVCGGGKPVKDCDVAHDLERGINLFPPERHYSELQSDGSGEDFTYPSYQAYFPLGCVACRQICEAVYQIKNGQRTEERPAVFSMDLETYKRVRAVAFESLKRLLKASIEEDKKDRLTGE